jgi:hypothetical protein
MRERGVHTEESQLGDLTENYHSLALILTGVHALPWFGEPELERVERAYTFLLDVMQRVGPIDGSDEALVQAIGWRHSRAFILRRIKAIESSAKPLSEQMYMEARLLQRVLDQMVHRYATTDTSGWTAWLAALCGAQPRTGGGSSTMPIWTPGTDLAPPAGPQVIQRQ